MSAADKVHLENMSSMEKLGVQTFYSFFSMLLNSDDIFPIDLTVIVIQHLPLKLYDAMTRYLPVERVVVMLWLVINFSIGVYQNLMMPWTSYFAMTAGGQAVVAMLLTNPIALTCYMSTFYLELLQTQDKAVFDNVLSSLESGASVAANYNQTVAHTVNAAGAGAENLKTLITQFASSSLGKQLDPTTAWLIESVLKNGTTKVLRIMVSGKFLSAKETQLEGELRRKKVAMRTRQLVLGTIAFLSEAGIMLPEKSTMLNFSKTDFDFLLQRRDHVVWVEQNKKLLKNQLSHRWKGGNKRQAKLELKQALELTKDGEVVCLDNCTDRTQTAIGCYCESSCGSSFVFGDETWCWVDPTKCKRKQALQYDELRKKYFDRCDPAKKSNGPVCYTGYEWKPCQNNDKTVGTVTKTKS